MKLCGNCAFPQNFDTRKLGEIMAFYAVHDDGVDVKNVLQSSLLHNNLLRNVSIVNQKVFSKKHWA